MKVKAADGAGADRRLRLFHILCSQFLVTAVCSVRTLSWVVVAGLDFYETMSAQTILLSRKGGHRISEKPQLPVRSGTWLLGVIRYI